MTTITKYSPQESAVPFYTTVDLTSKASTDAPAAVWVAADPCYNAIWAEFHITCATKDVTITITPDTTGGNMAATSVAMTAGSTYTIWVLLNGTLAPLGLGYGSHTFKVELLSTGAGQHGTCTGHYTLHGYRRY